MANVGNSFRNFACIAALATIGLGGCGADPTLPIAASRKVAALAAPQGKSMQGKSMQGKSMQGTTLQGMSLQGLTLQGTTLQAVTLQGTTLQATTQQGTTLQGAALQGLTLGAVDENNVAVTLRIAEVRTDPHDSSGDLLLYALELQDAETGTWANVCNADPYGERWAFPVQGSWDAQGSHVNDATRFSVACTAGVIAKCMRWGYKPFRSVNGQSLAPYHQACTRMARADYCGDGVSHTQDGTTIDMFDAQGVQTRTPTAPGELYFEGAWTPNGARCISKVRWQGMPDGTETGACYQKVATLSAANLNDVDRCDVTLDGGTGGPALIFNRSGLHTL